MNTLLLLTLFFGPLHTGTHGVTQKSMIVVTTKKIVSQSAKLADFIAAKEDRGYVVDVATEDDYGSAGEEGLPRALAIRAYLQSVHADYSYALLIGNAHADYGDVPMWKVWARHAWSASNCGGFPLDCRSHETDYLYADLTGDWDLNGNGQYGETGLDQGDGGIDLVPELLVSRIPVYFDDYRELDQILTSAIDYGNAAPADIAYRKKALLPAAFYYFKGQEMVGYSFPDDVDGSVITEWFFHRVIESSAGYTATRLYEREGIVTSRLESELALTRENLISAWKDGYGMIFWMGHGLQKEVARVIWTADTNGDGLAQDTEMSSALFIHSDDAESIGSGRPGFVVGVSCEIGSAETYQNLTAMLLLHGAAVGMLGSSSVTPGSVTDWANLESEMELERSGADNIGVLFFQDLIAGKTAGEAIWNAKLQAGTENDSESLAGRTMLNFFGDPTLSLDSTMEDIVDPEPEDPPGKGDDSGCSTAAPGTASGSPGASILVLTLFFMARRRRSR
ncbi:hypothetical protein KKD52_17120 [Myxococcota bacterium]|nr:hypothetical protein [Myxococcota bacterium]MBU1411166.1 hypothetical protein [Myxococcota bacterium]MBU1512077.1 hypothetical protein [Myxococcota bacterium]